MFILKQKWKYLGAFTFSLWEEKISSHYSHYDMAAESLVSKLSGLRSSQFRKKSAKYVQKIWETWLLIELVNILFGASCGTCKRSFAAGNREAGRTTLVIRTLPFREDGMSREVDHSPPCVLSLTLVASSLGDRIRAMHLCLNFSCVKCRGPLLGKCYGPGLKVIFYVLAIRSPLSCSEMLIC